MNVWYYPNIWPNIWVAVLTVLAALSAYLTIRAEGAGTRTGVYIFKPLTLVFLILLALPVKYPVAHGYRYLLVAGLVCSLVGDIFLMLPADKFVAGLLSFLVAHLFYAAAFALWGGVRGPKWSVLPLVAYGVLMLCLLCPSLGRMRAPVLFYMTVILLMGWQALSRWLGTGESGSQLAAWGALWFIASDSLLAFNRFRRPFRRAQLFILTTYFIAQWLIALST